MSFSSKTYKPNTLTQAHPLAFFRFCFGLLMLISIIRFWAKGWIHKLYIEPTFHFTFYGFDWVKPLGQWTYLLFLICGVAALFVAIGFKYRLAIITFFVTFTYIELMDKTTYLNHYYFVSMMSLLLCFLPANSVFSLDAYLKPRKYGMKIPRWTIDAVKFLLAIVYVYAGLAKLNSDWLVHAQPLKTWLATKTYIPIIGQLLTKEWVAYAFSYFGAVYDLTIPFFLLNKRTRPLAFFTVIVFHVMTRILFPIGMFPFIMIVSTIIFFNASFHKKIIDFIERILPISKRELPIENQWNSSFIKLIVGVFLVLQLLIPFRYLLYPGELFWTEEGFRFSWRVMLMEKAGYAQFKIKNKTTGKWFYAQNDEFLTPFQEKQMAFQPDFIVQYAHYLQKVYEERLGAPVSIFVESYVSLNGRGSQPFIRPDVDLSTVDYSLNHKTWILPFNDEIKGL